MIWDLQKKIKKLSHYSDFKDPAILTEKKSYMLFILFLIFKKEGVLNHTFKNNLDLAKNRSLGFKMKFWLSSEVIPL